MAKKEVEKDEDGYEPDGSPGEPGKGFGKGNVVDNSDKYNARTKAQQERMDKQADKMG